MNSEMSLEEKVLEHHALGQKIAELEAERKALGARILGSMQNKTMQVSDLVARRYTRLSIKMSLEEAQRLDATKVEEVIDREKIKALYQLGRTPESVQEISYVVVSKIKSREEVPHATVDSEF